MGLLLDTRNFRRPSFALGKALLRGRVRGEVVRLINAAQIRSIRSCSQAQIGQVGNPFSRNKDVRRLYVAVKDLLAVQVVERRPNLTSDPDGEQWGECTILQHATQRLRIQLWCHEIVAQRIIMTRVNHRHQMWVSQPCRQARR